MATTDKTDVILTPEIQPEQGKSDLPDIEQQEIKPPEETQEEKMAKLPDPTGLSGNELSDSDKAIAKKAESTGNDFYDEFIAAKEQANFVSDFKSADTYWNNRTAEREQYIKDYGDKAREVFDEDYKKMDSLWRTKLDKQTEKVVLNDNYSWLFGDRPDVDYTEEPVFETSRAIYNGARKQDHILTDKPVSDHEAVLDAKTYMNDKGEFVELKDNEKWWSWSKGTGTEMNADDPTHRSHDGKNRKIMGFEYVAPFDPEYRGTPYVKALYDGDFAKGELVSMWDTTNVWLMKSNGKTAGSVFKMLPKTAIRTVTNLSADVITGTTSILASIANLLDVDDDGNRFIDAMNNTSTAIKSRKLSVSEYDASKTITLSNGLDFVAQVAAQLYIGMGMFKGVNALTKVFLAKNPLLMEAAALEKAGKIFEAGKKVTQFEMTHGKAARAASLIGLTLATGDQVVTEARAAGFNEDEVASIYLAYFAAMMAANTVSNKMLEPYFTDATAEPIMRDIVKKITPLWGAAKTDAAKLGVAKRMVNKMADAVSNIKALPALASVAEKDAPTSAATALRMFKTKQFLYAGLNEALEEEYEFVGQEAVELFATMYSKRVHQGEANIPKFDTFQDDGYWARQLPNVVMSGLGGFMGGAMTRVLPGFAHSNEDDFLIKGDEATKMQHIAMDGGVNERRLLNQITKQKKSGALGSDLLSVKMDDKTGKFYKMTDKEAEGSISHAEASYRAIMGQYLTYKTLYGRAGSSYDEMIAADKDLAKELEASRDTLLYKQISDLHQKKYRLITDIMGTNAVPIPADTKSKKPAEVTKKAEAKEVVPEDPSKKTGVVVEPDLKAEKERAIDYSKEMATRVTERAALMGTPNLEGVRQTLEIEDQIDDILSGKAAAQQVVQSIVRTKKINVFIGSEQKDLFGKMVDSKGVEVDSPFTNFGEKLLTSIFTADSNLARGHARLHADYIADAKIISDLLGSAFTIADLNNLAVRANKTPKSLAIDPDTTQLQQLGEGIDRLLGQTINDKEYGMIISAARTMLQLDPNKDTSAYNDLIAEAAGQAVDDGTLTDLSPEEITKFVEENFDLLYKASKSVYIDKLVSHPHEFYSAQINQDQGKFKEEFIKTLKEIPNLSMDPVENLPSQSIITAETIKLKAEQAALETLRSKEPKDAQERRAQEAEAKKIRFGIDEIKSKLAKAQVDISTEGPFDTILSTVGSFTIKHITETAPGKDLTPVVRTATDAVKTARDIVDNFHTIIANIAPVVPTVPQLGALQNLLNEISVDGKTLVSTLNKIISPNDEEHSFTILNGDGKTVIKTAKIPSKIDQFQNSIINEKSDNPEFRDLEEAKHVLNSIRIRKGQVELIVAAMDKLAVLQLYSKEHIPAGNNRYDTLPKFMAEHIIDPERRAYLMGKTVLSKQDSEDLGDMLVREELLTNFANPMSIHARLKIAEEKVEQFIEMGIKSLDLNERFRVYVNEVASDLNAMKKDLNARTDYTLMGDEISAAIAKFSSITDTFKDSEHDTLRAGKAAMDEILALVYKLPIDKKLAYLDSVRGFNTSYAVSTIAGSMFTDYAQFEHYYTKVLSDQNNKGTLLAPTIAQERMIRSIFNFLTDENSLYSKLGANPNPVMLFADGGNGTGKSTMAGNGIASAQQYMDKRVVDNLGTALVPGEVYNSILYAAPFERQAKKIRDLSEAAGARPNKTTPPLTKKELYTYLKDKTSLDDVSIIVFDEATFIEGRKDPNGNEAVSELEWFVNKITELNSNRKAGIPKLKMLLIGDEGQGGFHEGMPNMFQDVAIDVNPDYSALGARCTPLDYGTLQVQKTDRLTYPFRTLCGKVAEISDKIKSIRSEVAGMLYEKEIKTSKLFMSSGVINNDADRGRFGGVEVITDPDKLYNDVDLVENLKKQFRIDKETNTDDAHKFTVLVVDDRYKSAKDMPAGIFRDLADSDEHRARFTFLSITAAQGAEADYTIGYTTEIFPKLPVKVPADAHKLDRLSMVISRSKLYSRITASQEVNLETVKNAVISMLTQKEADDLTKVWNDFYLTKYRNIGPIKAAPAVVVQEGIKEETKVERDYTIPFEPAPPITKLEDTPVPVDPGVEVKEVVLPDNLVAVLNVEKLIPADKLEDKKTAIDEKINNKNISKKAKEKLEAQREELDRTAIELVNPFNEPIESTLSEEIDKAVEEDMGTIAKSTTVRATEEAAHMETELETVYGYLRLKANESVDFQMHMRLLYASDLFGRASNKSREIEALKTIREVVSELSDMKRTKPEILRKYHFSLVSFQNHVLGKNKDEVVHQIYVEKQGQTSKQKVLLAMLPGEQFKAGGPMWTLLKNRTALIEDTHAKFKALYQDATTQRMFDSPYTSFGPAGNPITEDAVARINAGLKVLIPNGSSVFPTLPENTVIGRVAISDTKIADDGTDYAAKKMASENRPIGLLYMETALGSVENVFMAVTPGKPLTSNTSSQQKYAALKPVDAKHINSMWLANNTYYGASDNDMIKNIEKVITKNTKITLADVNELKKSVLVSAVAFNGYIVLTFEGINGRKISVQTNSEASFKLVYGFDIKGNPIGPETSDDLEVNALVYTLGRNLIKSKDLKESVGSVADMNAILGSYYNYDPGVPTADGVSLIEKITTMATAFTSAKIMKFSDLQISLGDFKTMVVGDNKTNAGDGITLSDVLTFTKTTKGNHQGKAFILYTYRKDIDLKNTDTLNQLLTRLSIDKPTNLKKETFNAEKFARHGVGLIMLDSKMQTIEGLLTKYSGAKKSDMNRASSPVGSETNRRMVALIKELALITKSLATPAGAHNLLNKMNLTSDGKVEVELFDDASKKSLITELTRMASGTVEEQAVYEAFQKLLEDITSDPKLGYIAVNSKDETDAVRDFLEVTNTQDRLAHWDEYIENKDGVIDQQTKDTLFAKWKVDRKHLFGLTDVLKARNGKVTHRGIIDKTTGRPAVFNPERNALTFIDPEYLQGSKPVFNMSHFIERIVAIGNETVASRVAKLFDTVMQNYTKEGTLRNGVMWTGRLSTSLASKLGVAKVDAKDVDTMYTTSVKEINPSAFMLSVPGLIQAVNNIRTTEKRVPVEPDGAKLAIEQKEEAKEIIHSMVLAEAEKIDIMATEAEIELAIKTTMQNIEKEYSYLLSDAEFTTIKKKMTLLFGVTVKTSEPAKKAAAEEVIVKEIIKASTPTTELKGDILVKDILSDMAIVVAGLPIDGHPKTSHFKALRQRVEEAYFLDKITIENRQMLMERINEHIVKTPPPEPIILPDGATMLQAFNDNIRYAKKATAAEKKSMQKLMKAIDSSKVVLTPEQKAAIPSLLMVLTDPYGYSALSDTDSKRVKEDAARLHMDLLIASGLLGYTTKQKLDLQNAFKALEITPSDEKVC
jgi:hypothetical protein